MRTGIDDISKNIKIFPNPVHDYLTIASSDNINDLTLIIYDFEGNMIRDIEYKGIYEDETRINLSDLKSGIYVLEVMEQIFHSTPGLLKLSQAFFKNIQKQQHIPTTKKD